MTNPDLFGDTTDGAAGIAAMAEAIKGIQNSVSKLAEKVDDITKKKKVDDEDSEPGLPGKMQAEFEKTISEQKEKLEQFEKDQEALKTELGTFQAKEHTEHIAGIVDAQFEKGLITEDKKVASAESLKDFTKEQLTAFGKQIELMNSEPTKSKAFKQSEPGSAGAAGAATDAAKLEAKKKEFSAMGLKPETAELMKAMEVEAV